GLFLPAEEGCSLFLYLLTHLFDVASGCSLSAEAEGKADGERDCDHDTGKEGLHECRSDLKLVKRREHRENPDGPACDRTEEVRRGEMRRACGTRNHPLCRLRDERSDEKDEHRRDDLREVAEHHVTKEDGDYGEVEHIERRHEEDDDEEPLHE